MRSKGAVKALTFLAGATLGDALAPHAPMRHRSPATRTTPTMGLGSFGKGIVAPLLTPEVAGVPVVPIVAAAAATAKIVVSCIITHTITY